jgi:hypothetical protein
MTATEVLTDDEKVSMDLQLLDENTESGNGIHNEDLSLQWIKNSSKMLLYAMVLGKGDDNEKKFLREIYYRTLEILAHSE